jgi:hypothetical protein
MKVLAFTVTFAAVVPAPEACSLNPEFVQQESVSWLRAGSRETCRHDISELAGALDRSLDNIPAGTTLRSIAVGRLISYPRLSESLKEMAASDAAWNDLTGKGHPSDNAVVARLLHESPEAAPLRVAIERHGYTLTGFSVEKVLVTSANGSRLPYDAILWLVVEPK